MKSIKYIVLFIGALTLLTTSGCIFPGHRGGGEYRDGGEYRGHGEYRGQPEYRGSPEPGVDIRIHGE